MVLFRDRSTSSSIHQCALFGEDNDVELLVGTSILNLRFLEAMDFYSLLQSRACDGVFVYSLQETNEMTPKQIVETQENVSFWMDAKFQTTVSMTPEQEESCSNV